ncbi:MAG: 4-phosphoerythronate dehydrogenase [Kiritimatiellia bacterium]
MIGTQSSSRSLNILCATSVAAGEEAFSSLGNVTMMPESEIRAGALRDVDVLITRSKVKVNDELLRGSNLQFYGTATAGSDHVDEAALAARGITWSEAAGCNARSVAEYVIASLAHLGRKRTISWRDRTLAIIGAGHVGSCLGVLAKALGLRVRYCDPPLAERTGETRYESLDDVLADADLVSLHVPLTSSGTHATCGMVNRRFFDAMKPGAIFINSSRGEVVADESELIARRADGRFGGLVLDVYHHEPAIMPELIEAADLATPHIAGYSLDGRLMGTQMIYEAACRHFGREPRWRISANEVPGRLKFAANNEMPDDLLYSTILAAYDPSSDHAGLKGAIEHPSDIPQNFSALRANYPNRRSFGHFAVDLKREPRLATLGFVDVEPLTS